MGLIVITPPAALPVSVAEAQAHMNVATGTDAALIESFIAAAVEVGQNMTGRQFVEAEVDYTLDCFPRRTRHNPLGGIRLPLAPLVGVEGVYYLDADGVEQQLLSGEFVVDTFSLVPAVYPAQGITWPQTATDLPNAVRIRAGYGWPMDDSVSPPIWTGPRAIATWILVRVAALYEFRESFTTGTIVSDFPRSHVDGLLDPYVIPKVV